jgi:hypothetical protein
MLSVAVLHVARSATKKLDEPDVTIPNSVVLE